MPNNAIPCAIVAADSDNSKIGKCAATYASQSSCPATCPFLHAGCYGESGYTGFTTARLNKSAESRPIAIAEEEARLIDSLPGNRPLRLHVVGDARTDAAAQVLSNAAKRYTAKHGMAVWTYTHGKTRRESWGSISVLRSCHTMREVYAAHSAGFASALAVSRHTSDKAISLPQGYRGIPCPEQVGRADSCLSCGLCLNADRLHSRRLVILLAAHGQGVRKAIRNTYTLED